jgi:hypothetical protein
LDPKAVEQSREPEKEAHRRQARDRRRGELEEKFEDGGAVEAALRSILYIRRGEGDADERSFAVLKSLHDAQPPGRPRSRAQLKAALREQSALLRLDEERAVAAIPRLLPRDVDERARTLRSVHRMVGAEGALSSEGKRRLARIEKLYRAGAARSEKESADAGR